MPEQKVVKLVTTHVLYEMKHRGEKIAMLTAYDYSMARILDEAGIDIILVGDFSLQRDGWFRYNTAYHS